MVAQVGPPHGWEVSSKAEPVLGWCCSLQGHGDRTDGMGVIHVTSGLGECGCSQRHMLDAGPGWVADHSPAVLGPGLAGEVGGGHHAISLQKEPVSLSLITRQEAEAPHSPMGPAEADPKKLGGGGGALLLACLCAHVQSSLGDWGLHLLQLPSPPP